MAGSKSKVALWNVSKTRDKSRMANGMTPAKVSGAIFALPHNSALSLLPPINSLRVIYEVCGKAHSILGVCVLQSSELTFSDPLNSDGMLPRRHDYNPGTEPLLQA